MHFAVAETLLTRGLARAPRNGLGPYLSRVVQISKKRVEAGLAQSEGALALDPNLANA